MAENVSIREQLGTNSEQKTSRPSHAHERRHRVHVLHVMSRAFGRRESIPTHTIRNNIVVGTALGARENT